MTTLKLDTGLANPFSTGSGGATFEQLVGTSYLVSLLAGHLPRGLDWGIAQEVQFQQRWSGCVIDDVVIFSSDGIQDRKLALQLKHNLSFTRSDETFARVLADCWLVFTNATDWHFNADVDRVGIGLGVYNTKLDTHFRPLLEWAKTEQTADAFLQKVNTPRFSSSEKQEYLSLIRELLTTAKGTAITDDELWRFLKCFVVIHFDLENASSRDSTHCWNSLLDLLQTRDDNQARALFDSLCGLVARYNRSAGRLTAATVRAELPIGLKDQPQYEHDLTRLRRHSVSILSSISNTIGGQVRLPRVQIIDDITLQAHDNDIVVIAGEPMVGKSGLLKLLANRLHLEGEVFAFGVEEFAEATTLVDFLHNNGIMHDFHSLLTAVGNATLRCILIDGLERAITDNKRRVINDLLSAVRHYNSTLVAGDVFSEYRWRVVFTCRQQEMNNILVQLSGTRESVQNNTLSVIDVSTLTDEEIDEVKEQIPQLAAIVSSRHLKDIISRPLVLDILTLPGITLPPESLPIRLTETWLLDWFWQQVVRRADEARTGRGHPDARERLLMQLALQTINADGAPTTHTDDEALSGVLADRLLHRLDDGSLRFGHDVLEDWTLVMILRQHISNLGAYLIQIEEPLRLSRAFQLATIRLLEVQQDVPSWLALLRNLEHTPSLSPRWYRLAISALLSSDLIRDLLPRLQQALLDEDNALLCSVLRNMRLIEVQPDSTATYLFKGLPENEIEKLLAHFSIPIWKHWIHIIQFVLIHRHRLTQRGVLEFSYIVHKWLEKLDGN